MKATDAATIHKATVRLLANGADHRTDEDLHPARLDAVESALDEALDRDSFAKRAADRDARDA